MGSEPDEMMTFDERLYEVLHGWLNSSSSVQGMLTDLADAGLVIIEDQPDHRYEPALHCKRCGHFLLPHDVEGHERWHEEPNR